MRVQTASSAHATVLSVLWATELVRSAAAALARHGITPLVAGGALFQRTLYARADERFIDAVELAVAATDFERAARVLSAQGFELGPELSGPDERVLWSKTVPMAVRLQRRAFSRMQSDALIADAVLDTSSFGARVLVPAPRDQLCWIVGSFVCAPGSAARRDLANLLARHPLAPVAAATRLDEHGLGRAARFALPALGDAQSAGFCAGCRAELAADPLGDLIAAVATRARARGRPEVARRLLLAPRVRTRGERSAVRTHSPAQPAQALRAALAAALRGASPHPALYDESSVPQLAHAAELEGVAALVHAALPASAHALRAALAARVHDAAAIERARCAELTQVFEALGDASLSCLILKGTGLAYTAYASPELRPRIDTDLLFEDRMSAERAIALLCRRGYETSDAVSGEVVATQRTLHKALAWPAETLRARSVLDIHWRASNQPVFAAALPYSELVQASQPVARLGPHARTLGSVHALLLACVHRARHETNAMQDQLIWLYDIHLLALGLSDERWHALLKSATRAGVASEVHAGLVQARAWLGTPLPSLVMERLQAAAAAEQTWLAPLWARLSPQLRAELRALRALAWAERFTYLREHLAPSPDYMRARYGRGSGVLPVLYVKRAARGIGRALRAAAER